MAKRVPDEGGFGEEAGYSRAVRQGQLIAVSGTAPLERGRVLHPTDAYEQTKRALEIALSAAAELGAKPGRCAEDKAPPRTRLRLPRARSDMFELDAVV